MSKHYAKAPAEVAKRAASLIKKYHPNLDAVGIKIDFLSVTTDEEGAPALTLHGVQCAAIVKIVGLKERTKGNGDAEILIDEATYTALPDASKDALIDHELYHLELALNKHKLPKRDSLGRPKFKMRKHDVEFGWFAEIARRHGPASMEIRQATKLILAHKQTFFEFALKGGKLEASVQLLP